MLTSDIAEHIVRETMRRLRRNINIMDADGTIIASGRRERVGEKHAGAAEAIRRGETVAIAPGDERTRGGALPGVNMPIAFQGRTVGAIGITGDPGDVAEFAELVRMTTELMLQQAYLSSLKERRDRLLAAVAEELAKEAPDFARLRGHLELLRVAPAAPMRVCLARWETPFGSDGLLPLLRTLEQLWGPSAIVAATPDGRGFLIAACGCGGAAWNSRFERMRAAASAARAGARYGVSGEGAAVEELDLLLREAEFAVGNAAAAGDAVGIDGLEARQLVHAAPPRVKARLAARTADRLPGQLRATLQTYFDCNRNVQATADALYVHKNTVVYRLKKIAASTGFDPHRFADAAALQIGLWSAEGRER